MNVKKTTEGRAVAVFMSLEEAKRLRRELTYLRILANRHEREMRGEANCIPDIDFEEMYQTFFGLEYGLAAAVVG